MKKCRKQLIGLVTATVLLLTSCGQSHTVSSAENGKEGGDIGTGRLQVYYLSGSESSETILSSFEKDVTDIKIDRVPFASVEAMDAQITEQLQEDSGPDVILFTGDTGLDTMQMAFDGSFMDLSEMMNTVEKEQYYPLFGAGQANGRQVLLPLGFRLNYLLTTEEKLAEFDVALKDGYTVEDVFSAIETISNGCDDSQVAASVTYQVSPARMLYDQLRLTGVELVDYARQKVTTDQSVLETYAGYVKGLFQEFEKGKSVLTAHSHDFIGGMSKIGGLLAREQVAFYARYYDTLFAEGLGQKMKLIAYPDLADEKELTVDVTLYAAVSPNSKQWQNASRFLQYALDVNYGSTASDLSVRRENVEAMDGKSLSVLQTLSFNRGKGIELGSKTVMISPLDEEICQMLLTLLQRVSHGSIRSSKIERAIDNAMTDFIKGTEDFESSYAGLMNELQLYLYE